MRAALHHVELWTTDLAGAAPAWEWLLTTLGWRTGDAWDRGRTWVHGDGTYLVLEQSTNVRDEPHDRLRPGLNHLALNSPSTELLDVVRGQAAAHGWRELFADSYPHAGGLQHTALFLEDDQGFEVELVGPAPTPPP